MASRKEKILKKYYSVTRHKYDFIKGMGLCYFMSRGKLRPYLGAFRRYLISEKIVHPTQTIRWKYYKKEANFPSGIAKSVILRLMVLEDFLNKQGVK